jgi:hypothetical protein
MLRSLRSSASESIVERQHTRFGQVATDRRQITPRHTKIARPSGPNRAREPRLAAPRLPGFGGLSGLVLVGLPRAPAVEAKSPLDRCVACTASSALNDRAVRRGGQVRVIRRGVGREFDLAVIAIVGHPCRRIQSPYASQASAGIRTKPIRGLRVTRSRTLRQTAPRHPSGFKARRPCRRWP